MSENGKKEVFCYEIDGKKVYADPFTVHRNLVRALQGDVEGAFEMASLKLTPTGKMNPDGTPEEAEAPNDHLRRLDGEERLAKAAYKVFGLAPFDPATGQGTTEETALSLLNAWAEYTAKNESSTVTTAT